jgi:predicted DNA-binding transcriptional regulator AlpA
LSTGDEHLNNFKNWGELPLSLNTDHVSKILGLSKPLVYALFNRSDFPAIKITAKRWVVPKDQFKDWLNNETAKKGGASNG